MAERGSGDREARGGGRRRGWLVTWLGETRLRRPVRIHGTQRRLDAVCVNDMQAPPHTRTRRRSQALGSRCAQSRARGPTRLYPTPPGRSTQHPPAVLVRALARDPIAAGPRTLAACRRPAQRAQERQPAARVISSNRQAANRVLPRHRRQGAVTPHARSAAPAPATAAPPWSRSSCSCGR